MNEFIIEIILTLIFMTGLVFLLRYIFPEFLITKDTPIEIKKLNQKKWAILIMISCATPMLLAKLATKLIFG
jgi:hypothetical protein